MSEKYPYAVPRRWKNKISGKEYKVVPWFVPMEKESRFDFVGLIKECFPELVNDQFSDFEVYKGLVLRAGWLIENEHNVYFALPMNIKDQFEDIGEWKNGCKSPS